MEKRDTQTSIRLPSALRDHLRELADAEQRTLASYIVRVLEKHVAIKTKHSGVPRRHGS